MKGSLGNQKWFLYEIAPKTFLEPRNLERILELEFWVSDYPLKQNIKHVHVKVST